MLSTLCDWCVVVVFVDWSEKKKSLLLCCCWVLVLVEISEPKKNSALCCCCCCPNCDDGTVLVVLVFIKSNGELFPLKKLSCAVDDAAATDVSVAVELSPNKTASEMRGAERDVKTSSDLRIGCGFGIGFVNVSEDES